MDLLVTLLGTLIGRVLRWLMGPPTWRLDTCVTRIETRGAHQVYFLDNRAPAKHLKAAYFAIKAQDPTAFVITEGLIAEGLA